MVADDRYKVFGVYLSESVADSLESHLYERAGIVDLESYLEETADSVPAGDPGAEAMDEFVAGVLESFPDLYDAAAFESAAAVSHDEFDLVRLAAAPRRVSDLRERFQAAATVRDADLQTIHTGIVEAALEQATPDESEITGEQPTRDDVDSSAQQ
ncbi:hypothetical protein [Halopiger goleimassiliensis]|uniref:hypothetical protein n=1 Tax=Halopiger goleimassiliensis TaxID=1293048 RepID=UPI000678267A|nr:hypothetical protein [Halopiger goleimassiliensis]